MITKLTKRILIGSILLVAVLGIGLRTNTIKLPITKTMSPMYVTDFSDNRKLIGASHNVFIGKVVKQSGDKALGSSPETQFVVDVILNIKGDLKGGVVVNQFGGYKNGVLYLMRGGDVVVPTDKIYADADTLLEIGATYLFATRYNSEENWHTLISHPNARKILNKDTNIDKERLEMLVQNDEKVVVLNEAYKNEILLEADILNNNTRNSYQSLQGNK